MAKTRDSSSKPNAHEFQIIDKVCAELSIDAAALMLELARGMTAQGWDQSGSVMRAQSNLERRLKGSTPAAVPTVPAVPNVAGKTIPLDWSHEFQQLIAECADGEIE